MDSQFWHDYCIAAEPTEPPALTTRQWKNLKDDQRAVHIKQLKAWLYHIYIQTDEITAINKQLTQIIEENTLRLEGTRDIVALTGPNFIGKSTLLMRWGREQYRLWVSGAPIDKRGRPVITAEGYEADLCPLVWINLPSESRRPDVDREFLDYFDLAEQGRVKGFTHRVVKAMRRHRAQTAVMDDVHLLSTNWAGGRGVLDHIKHLNTKLGLINATLILAGANLEDGDLVHDPQIRCRLRLLELRPYMVGGANQDRTWQRVVRQFEGIVLPHLPSAKPGDLFLRFPGELWYRTEGYLGDLTKLVCGAAMEATTDGTHRILQRHLDAVVLSERCEDLRRV